MRLKLGLNWYIVSRETRSMHPAAIGVPGCSGAAVGTGALVGAGAGLAPVDGAGDGDADAPGEADADAEGDGVGDALGDAEGDELGRLEALGEALGVSASVHADNPMVSTPATAPIQTTRATVEPERSANVTTFPIRGAGSSSYTRQSAAHRGAPSTRDRIFDRDPR